MKSFMNCLATGILLLGSTNIATAAIINLNPFEHVKGTGVTYSPLVVSLDAGIYVVTPVIDQYTAFSPWSSNRNCSPSCVGEGGVSQGFAHYFGVTIDGNEIFSREDTYSGLFYSDPTDAFNAAIAFHEDNEISFTLNSLMNVEFYIPTGFPLSDNRGGISLELSNVSPVPTPSAFWLMISGLFGLIGLKKSYATTE